MTRSRRLVQDSAVLVPGPWLHRDVSANGIRLHVAEAGTGPLVVLLHGFPQFWWSWRHQLVALADAGFRAVAPDLRGYGASDKPPRGYDSLTLTADITGLIRALGERDAILVGHGWGGHLAWTAASVAPTAVRKLAVVSAPHPLAWAGPLSRSRHQRAALSHVARFQLPWHPERWLVADDGAHVAELLRSWGGPGYPDDETEQRARDAMAILAAPHGALEYFRWAVRSVPRADGRRYRRLLRQPVTAPTLQLHGALDDYVLPATAQNSARRVSAAYEWRLIGGVGHFPHEEAPHLVAGELVRWCKDG